MKFMLILGILFISFTIIFAQNAPFIEGGRYNSVTKAIEINVQYVGGCAEHKFQLEIGAFRKTYPAQCDAKLIDLTTDDYCDALIYRKVSIDIHEVGLDTIYYTGASIQIQGTGDSKVSITLP